jgi:alpha-glucosidase
MAKPAGLPDMDITDLQLLESADDDLRFDRDGVHDIHRMIRRVLDEYPEAMAVGEVWVRDDDRLRLYIRPDELHLSFNFRSVEARWRADELRSAVEHELHVVAGTRSPPCWVLSNHDVVRHVSRYGEGLVGDRRARAAAMVVLALPGVAYLYNGEELGLPNVELPDEVLQDPTWLRSGRTARGRDACRIPMPWTVGEPPYGFSPHGADTWLPMPAGWSTLSVEAQEADPASMLALYTAALSLRRKDPALSGDLEWLDMPAGSLAFRREGGMVCVLNTTNSAVDLPAGYAPEDVVLASVPLLDGRLAGDAAVWLAA